MSFGVANYGRTIVSLGALAAVGIAVSVALLVQSETEPWASDQAASPREAHADALHREDALATPAGLADPPAIWARRARDRQAPRTDRRPLRRRAPAEASVESLAARIHSDFPVEISEARVSVRTEIAPPLLLESRSELPLAPTVSRSGLGAHDAGSAMDAGSERGLVMYATEWCSVCSQARRWMSAQGIEFDERDVEEDRSAARRHTELNPRRTVPTFERDGRTLIGFSPMALRGLLGAPR